MSEQENKPASDLLAAKRAAVLESRSSKRKLLLPALGLVLAVGLAGFFGLRMMPEEEQKPAEGAMFGFVPTTGEVSYPLTDFDGAGVNFYQHKADDGVLVRYFIYVGPDGKVIAALDTCGSCWQAGQGHRQDGDVLTCATCDKRFALADWGETSDPCKPIALPATVRDGRVVISVPDLLGGAKYFKKQDS